jgi:hypothetical protein
MLDLQGANEADNDEAGERYYPERVSFRLAVEDRSAYDAMQTLGEDAKIADTHILLAMMDMLRTDPQMRTKVVARAREIEWRNKVAANQRKSESAKRRATMRRKRT